MPQGVCSANNNVMYAALPEDPSEECKRDWVSDVLEALQTGEGEEEGLVCVGMACLRVQQGQWKEVCELLKKGVFSIKFETYNFIFLACRFICVSRGPPPAILGLPQTPPFYHSSTICSCRSPALSKF